MTRAGYQYETSPRKLQPSYRPKKKPDLRVLEVRKQKNKVSGAEKKKQLKLAIYIVGIFALLLTISYRNSQINEKFNKVQSLKRQISSLQKENEQTKVNIENNLNSNYIEQQAKEKLGMRKLTNKQTIYINLPKKDYVESPSEKVVIEEEEEKGWLEQFLSSLFGN